MEQKQFEEAEKILSWRDMQPGVYIFVDKEVRGMNKWMKPRSVVSLKEKSEGRRLSTMPLLHSTIH